jgi:hypothetical protein
MSSQSSTITNEHQPASDASITLSASGVSRPRGRRRSLVPLLASVFAASLPTALRPKAREAAAAAIKATRPADALTAARGVLERVPARAKLAIRDALAARKDTRDERARARALAVPDRYAVPFRLRLPRLREQHDREHYARVWKWIEETAD